MNETKARDSLNNHSDTRLQTNNLPNPLHLPFLQVFRAAEKLVALGEPAILAIDGRCGSGKTALSGMLSETFDCNVFHMDDYFLPPELRTEERLSQPGGNVDYERFLAEVLRPLSKGRDVCYRPFDCVTGMLQPEIHIPPKTLSVVEGSYALHPALKDCYSFSVFLTVKPDVQRQRILQRNGEKMLKRFLKEWIPLEELYFKDCVPPGAYELTIDTSELFIQK